MDASRKFVKPKFYLGSKAITIYDPAWFLSLFANHIFDPIITPIKVDKEGVLLYLLQIRDNNTGKTLDVQWELPESISNSVKLQSSSREVESDELEAVWETNDTESNSYKSDVNRCLEFWLKQIQQANSFGESPEIRFLQMTTTLKWPWKTATNETYFKQFRATDHTHIIRLGVGYFQSENQVVGASIQLSSYPGKSIASVLASKSRKRKKAETIEEGSDDTCKECEG
jgi:hypothetical protein